MTTGLIYGERMDRRRLLQLVPAGLLGASLPVTAATSTPETLPRIRFIPDQIFRTTICLRPFRAEGPRIEAENVGRKRIIHNYGHGGSGWSLSWGSAEHAIRLALDTNQISVAVIGAGAIGLTTALTAQRAGLSVTIYAKDRFPFVRSAHATGTWSPDSRIALTERVAPDFAERWEDMARKTHVMHQSYLGLADNPVEWTDYYYLRPHPTPSLESVPAHDQSQNSHYIPNFIRLESRLRDISPRFQPVPDDQHPFDTPQALRRPSLTFNIAALSHQLSREFLIAGGKFVPMTFHTPSDLNRLKEKVILNCTGYGARALWQDETIVPVRGQITWLTPQANTHYGFYYKGISVIARRDGIVVQPVGADEGFGWNDDNEQPDMDAAYAAITALADAYRA